MSLHSHTIDEVKVPLQLSAERFRLDENFTAPPLARDKTEPAWDSLLPSTSKRVALLAKDLLLIMLQMDWDT